MYCDRQLSSREVLVLMYNLSTISSSQLSSCNPPIFKIDSDFYKPGKLISMRSKKYCWQFNGLPVLTFDSSDYMSHGVKINCIQANFDL